jgi:Protein of unknown function (DUF2946)
LDEAVTKAMTKWPNVPDIYGWLRLDGRGVWHLIDRNIPGFDEAQHGKGSSITSPGILDFLGRNYACDERGCWYWQNGPQRAFAELDVAPLVYRVLNRDALPQGMIELVSHTGYQVQRVREAAIDQAGRIWITTELGPGVVHDLDASNLRINDDVEPMRVQLGEQHFAMVEIERGETTFGFEKSPLALSAKQEQS